MEDVLRQADRNVDLVSASFMDERGRHLNTVRWSKQGDCSVILEIKF